MQPGRTVFAELMSYVSPRRFRTCVDRYDGDRKVSRFRCWDQFLCMAFAQLTYRESLRDIEACLRAVQPRLYHLGIRTRVSRSTIADANETRDWRIYRDFAQGLIQTARALYVDEPLAADLGDTVYALDATIIELRLAVFPWAHYRRRDAAIKLHTLVDASAGLISDHVVLLGTADSREHYPQPLRRVRYRDPDTKKRFSFLTNNFTLPAITVALLYKSRWQVELFFKWIKQHLRIKAFYGVSENAVKTQVWIALSVYVLVAIVKKRLGLDVSLYKLLQVLSITLFEKMPISTAVSDVAYKVDDIDDGNQLQLFDL